ncbi:MAG: hypothetical protein ABI231_04860 [Candidatus Tumulicola sp.]
MLGTRSREVNRSAWPGSPFEHVAAPASATRYIDVPITRTTAMVRRSGVFVGAGVAIVETGRSIS